jgi:hypothetical protein
MVTDFRLADNANICQPWGLIDMRILFNSMSVEIKAIGGSDLCPCGNVFLALMSGTTI